LLQSLALKISSVLSAHADVLLARPADAEASAAASEAELQKAPPKESYRLVSTASQTNVGLFVFARVHSLGRREDVGEKGRITGSRVARVALGPPRGLLGNKGAAAVRLWVERGAGTGGSHTETVTCVHPRCCILLADRIQD
jgi:hypothetical protein